MGHQAMAGAPSLKSQLLAYCCCSQSSNSAVEFRSNLDALHAGIGYVPEHRMLQGLVMPQSIGDNITIKTANRISGKLLLYDVLHLNGNEVSRMPGANNVKK